MTGRTGQEPEPCGPVLFPLGNSGQPCGVGPKRKGLVAVAGGPVLFPLGTPIIHGNVRGVKGCLLR